MQSDVPASTCVVNPEPPNWKSVPAEDHARLNAVFVHWATTWGGIHEVSIRIEPSDFVLCIFLQAGHVVTAQQLAALEALPHVLAAMCDMSARGTTTSGGVCVHVQAASCASGPVVRGEAPPPIGARSYTAALRARSKAQSAELSRAARAAAGAV